jgi:hypothetical protein
MIGRWNSSVLLSAVLAMLIISVAAPRASAHEHVHVGSFEFTIGWAEEPPVVGVLNGLDLGIEEDVGGGVFEEVDYAVGNISAEFLFGGATYGKEIEPQFGRPGWYTFPIIPTRAGAYSVRVFGELNGTALDFTVQVEEVMSAADISFPAVQPTPDELAQANQETSLRLEETRAALAQAQNLAIAGLAAGVLGIAVGAVALLRRRPGP